MMIMALMKAPGLRRVQAETNQQQGAHTQQVHRARVAERARGKISLVDLREERDIYSIYQSTKTHMAGEQRTHGRLYRGRVGWKW